MIKGQTLTGIADAIRAQLGTEQQYTPESMAAAIGSIQGGGTALADSILDKSFYGTYKSANLTSIGQYMMQGQSGLTGFFAPNLKQIQLNAFSYCRALKYIYIQGGEIQSNSFLTCEGIVALVIKSTAVTTLNTAVALNGSSIASGTGYIYVPDDLVEQYKVATNWATYAAQIKGLSEIPAEVQEWLDQQGGASA